MAPPVPGLVPAPTLVVAPTPVVVATTTAPVSKEPAVPPTVEGIVYLPAEGAYVVTFDTILINYFVQTTLQTAMDAFMNRDSNVWAQLNIITANHILEHLRYKLKDYDNSLVLSVATNFSSLSIQEPWSNETILVSETLTGNVVIHKDYGMPRRDGTTNLVKESFEVESSMQSYLSSLHLASEPTLHLISDLYLGLPSEVIDTTTTTTPDELPTDTSSQNSEEKDNFMRDIGKKIEWGDWSNTYFITFVAIVGGVIFMLFSTIILCYWLRKRVRRRQELKDLKSKSSDEMTNDILSPTSNESTENTSNAALRVIALSPSKTTPMEDSNSKSSEDVHLAEAPKSFYPNGRYVEAEQSEDDDDIQSDVYSYIDTNTIDDHCYSVAGALMYNPHIPGDDQHSVNWSVAGRNTVGGAGNLLNMSGEHTDIYQTPQRTNSAQPETNLSGMLSENSPTNDDVVIFCDSGVEDDSVSLINDSLLQNTTLDHTEQQAEQYVHRGGVMLLPSKHSNKEAMSTNARVAAVVAKLEGKTLLSESFSSQTTQTERTTNRNDNEEGGRMKGAGSRCEGTEEGDPSSEESVALSSYVARPYQTDRQAAATQIAKETNSKPPIASRPQSARLNGKSARGKSSFFRSTSTGSSETNVVRPNNSWEIPAGESTNEKDNKVAASDERKKGFWARTQSNRNSKATQMVLGDASSPCNDSAPKTTAVTSPTETFVSPVASSPSNNDNNINFLPVQQIKLFEQYEESESDIQSICTFDDDRSYFSFVKTAKGNAQLTDQERNALNNLHNNRPPASNHQNSYIQSMYKKY